MEAFTGEQGNGAELSRRSSLCSRRLVPSCPQPGLVLGAELLVTGRSTTGSCWFVAGTGTTGVCPSGVGEGRGVSQFPSRGFSLVHAGFGLPLAARTERLWLIGTLLEAIAELPPRKKTSRTPRPVLPSTPLKRPQQHLGYWCQLRGSSPLVLVFFLLPRPKKLSPEASHWGWQTGFTLVWGELFLFTLLKVTGVTCLLKPNAHPP